MMPIGRPANAATDSRPQSWERWANFDAFLANNWTLWAAAVFLLQGALIVKHEPWLDEWQALMIAVQSPTLSDLLVNLRYEGHPPLWYLALRFASALVGTEYALKVTALAFAAITQWLILFKSPFPREIRLAVALSELVLFEFNTISRGYTLGLTLTFCVVWLWNSRRLIWLPLSLLPCVDFFFGVFSVIFIALRFRDRRPWIPGFAAWLAISLFSAWAVLPANDNIPAFPPSGDLLTDGFRYVFRLSAVMLPVQWEDGPTWDKLPPAYSYVVLWIPFVVTCLDQTRSRAFERIALAAFLLTQLAFFTASHPLTTRHVLLTGILLIAVHWIQADEGVSARPWLRMWLGTSAACGLAVAVLSFAMPFDTARRAAERIRELDLEDKRWVTYPTMASVPVTAWNGVLFERLDRPCVQDFVRWNFPRQFNSRTALVGWAEREARSNGQFYILSRRVLPASPSIREIEVIEGGYNGFNYRLYEVGGQLPEGRKSQERCVPGMNSWEPLL